MSKEQMDLASRILIFLGVVKMVLMRRYTQLVFWTAWKILQEYKAKPLADNGNENWEISLCIAKKIRHFVNYLEAYVMKISSF